MEHYHCLFDYDALVDVDQYPYLYLVMYLLCSKFPTTVILIFCKWIWFLSLFVAGKVILCSEFCCRFRWTKFKHMVTCVMFWWREYFYPHCISELIQDTRCVLVICIISDFVMDKIVQSLIYHMFCLRLVKLVTGFSLNMNCVQCYIASFICVGPRHLVWLAFLSFF